MSTYIRVWDPLVRVGHWTIVTAFAVAYLSGEEVLSVHVWAGYVVGAAVSIRVIWGFVGPQRARFSDFIYSPQAVLTYFADLVRFRSRRYLGHSPAGGAMVIALLLMLAGTVVTGLMNLGADKHTGPLASFYVSRPVAELPTAITQHAGGETARGQTKEGEESAVRELHELFANLTLIFAGFHFAGVVLASLVHRENLVAAMITGRKRAERDPPNLRGGPVFGR